MSKPKTLKLDDITIDGDTQSRVKINEAVVKEYAEHIQDGGTLPPVDVCHDGSTYWLWDGFHRLLGHHEAGILEIACNVTRGTQQEAQWLSYGANKSHGLRRTNDDKKKSVVDALKHPAGSGMSDELIAEHVGVSRQTVLKYRHEIEPTCQKHTSRTGKDGRKTETAKIGKKADSQPAEPVDVSGWDDPESVSDPAVSFYDGDPDEDGEWKVPDLKEEAKPFDILLRELGEWEKRVIGNLIEADEPGTAFLDRKMESEFKMRVNNIRELIKGSRPYSICADCMGQRCKTCRQSGLVPRRFTETMGMKKVTA